MDLSQIPVTEDVTLSEVFVVKNEAEQALPSEGEELFDISNICLTPKFEDVSFPSSTGPFKLEADTQEFEPTGFDNEGVECPSTSAAETLRESSNSSLSPERQNLSEGVSSRISTSLLEFDSLEVDSDDEGVMHSTVCRSDDVSQPILFGPKPIVMLKKLKGKAIEELTMGIWRCGSCGKAEKSFLMLDLHVDTGCEELTPIECVLCPTVERDYSNFVVHFMEHQMGGTRRCAICLRESIVDMRQHLVLEGHFSPSMSKLDLKKNESLVVSQNWSTSGYSNSSKSESGVKDLDDQKKHPDFRLNRNKHRKLKRRKNIQIKNKIHKCSSCNKFFSTLSHLSRHQIVHTGEKPYKCEICKKCFSSLDNLKQHQIMHNGEGPFECDICKKCFPTSSHLKQHQVVHTGEKPFKCDICNKCFSQSSNLNRHRMVHTGEKPYKCDICKKCFALSSRLNRHQIVHTGEKPFKCEICKKCFSTSSDLKDHLRRHTGEKPFECDLCKKCFATSSKLKRHQMVHTGEKRFKCEICKKCFATSSELNRHQVVHTGEKPFKCEICKKCFALSSRLNRHQIVHTGEKPFKCEICKKCFSRSSYLKDHQRGHTGERPFECNICKRAFSVKKNLKYHLTTHSRKKSDT
ncbi:zinc finger protein ZFP2-like isoform X6 [Artemia franciscana]|uniref:zinc finger protein ZFP2-like isoform X6 n=1 Tax=Artemia franciscana TaxID=6661 RepID=UPI0032DA4D43